MDIHLFISMIVYVTYYYQTKKSNNTYYNIFTALKMLKKIILYCF